jgi:hypothetical protein
MKYNMWLSTFWDITPPSPLKFNRVSEEEFAIIFRVVCYHLHAGFLLGILFDPEDGDDMFLRIFSSMSTNYMVLYPRRQNWS